MASKSWSLAGSHLSQLITGVISRRTHAASGEGAESSRTSHADSITLYVPIKAPPVTCLYSTDVTLWALALRAESLVKAIEMLLCSVRLSCRLSGATILVVNVGRFAYWKSRKLLPTIPGPSPGEVSARFCPVGKESEVRDNSALDPHYTTESQKCATIAR